MISSCRHTACGGRSLIIRWQSWRFICRGCSSVRITIRCVALFSTVSHRPEVLVADEYRIFFRVSFLYCPYGSITPVGLYRKCGGCGNISQTSTRKCSTPWGWIYCGRKTSHSCLWVAFAFWPLVSFEFLTSFVPLFAFFYSWRLSIMYVFIFFLGL